MSTSTSLPLLPYGGAHYRHDHDSPVSIGQACTLTHYPPDVSGTKKYHINTLGYRGEDLRPDAKRRIFAAGCSYTFGTGLDEEEIWIHHFAEAYASAHGLERKDVNLLNFSEDGGSNDYITRILLAQCARIRPDVVIASITHSPRGEFIDRSIDPNWHRIGPWLLDGACDPARAPEFVRIMQLRDSAVVQRADWFFRYHSEEMLALQTHKNVLLLQYYCQANRIPYLLLGMPGNLSEDEVASHSRQYCDLIDKSHFAEVGPAELAGCEVDWAADALHPGPKVHRWVGERAWRRFRSLHAIE